MSSQQVLGLCWGEYEQTQKITHCNLGLVLCDFGQLGKLVYSFPWASSNIKGALNPSGQINGRLDLAGGGLHKLKDELLHLVHLASLREAHGESIHGLELLVSGVHVFTGFAGESDL